MALSNTGEIDIKDINLNDCFLHFTDKRNIPNILNEGLIPKIGNHAIGIEETEKIFFSKGGTGALQIVNIWIKWLIRRVQWNLYLQDAKDEEYYTKLAMYRQDAVSGKLYEDEEIKQQVFEYMVEFMNNNTYLLLDLQENQDFRYEDVDEAKIRANNNNTREDLNTCYGLAKGSKDISMEEWNMHTISGVRIEPTKINVIKNNQSYSAIDVVKYVYSITPKENLNISFLDEFLDYLENIELDKTSIKK